MIKIWINNGDVEKYITEQDTIPEGFVKGRLKKKTKIDELVPRFSKDLIYKVFILDNKSFVESAQYLNLSHNEFRLLLTKYKIKKDPKLAAQNNKYKRPPEVAKAVGRKSAETQKERWKSLSLEEKQRWSAKQKEAHSSAEYRAYRRAQSKKQMLERTEEQKQLVSKKTSETLKQVWAVSKEDILHKRKQTEKANRNLRLCRTVAEQKLYDYLFPLYSDLQYDVRVDDRYPFYCDFYIKSLDLFIELQAHPCHGRLPFEYLDVSEYCKYPEKWKDVYYVRDVNKLQRLRKNNLNFVLIYPEASLEENLMINTYKDKDFITACYNTQK